MPYLAGELEELIKRSLRVLDGDPMVFFLGAGASAPAPSCMPQPWPIQAAAFECVAPAGAEADADFIAASLPEIYHEVLAEIGGEETRRIWSVLSLWEAPSAAGQLGRFELGPNLVHLLSTYLAWKSGTPLVTVNFDEMLERAAVRLGLNGTTSLDARTRGDSVAIWKLHGTVGDLASIRTTLQAITASDPRVLQAVEREFDHASGCLIGYSGRDIDFFPFLCGWSRTHPIYWLSLDLEETAIERFPGPFLGIDARAEEWAREVIARLPATDEAATRLKEEATRKLPDPAEVKAAYEGLIAEHAKRIYEPLFPPRSSRRMLAHAMTLAALGRNADADRWVDEFLTGPEAAPLQARAHLLKSALCHEFARYRDSRDHALQALRLAERRGLEAQACEATLKVDEARRMLDVPSQLPFVRGRDLFTRGCLATTAAMVVHVWKLRRWGQIDARAGMPPYPRLRAGFEYLEHLVRVGSLVQGMAEHLLPWRRVHRLFAAYWRWLEGRCYTAGYALGIGNTKKYELRQAPSATRRADALSVANLYELVPSPTGSAIHYRDVGEVAARETRGMAAGPLREARCQEAIEFFGHALADAEQAGDPSLALKAMLGLKGVDPRTTWSEQQVRALLDLIQSPAYEAFAEQIADTLTR
jgi:hypothetical protein